LAVATGPVIHIGFSLGSRRRKKQIDIVERFACRLSTGCDCEGTDSNLGLVNNLGSFVLVLSMEHFSSL
jgi:hypothetical protein